MSKFLSGRIKELLVGIAGRTENNTVVQTTGKVGIGTTNSQQHSLYVDGSTNIDGGVNRRWRLYIPRYWIIPGRCLYSNNELYVGEAQYNWWCKCW